MANALARPLVPVGFALMIGLAAVTAMAGAVEESQDGFELRLNEILFKPSASQASFVELKNVGTGSVALSDFSLTNKRGDTYGIPTGLRLPASAIALVTFDGQNVIDGYTIHSAVSTFLDPDDDALILKDASGAVVVSSRGARTSPSP